MKKRKIRFIKRKPPKISVADLIEAFGARPTGIKLGNDKAPVALLTIRDILFNEKAD